MAYLSSGLEAIFGPTSHANVLAITFMLIKDQILLEDFLFYLLHMLVLILYILSPKLKNSRVQGNGNAMNS